MARQAAAAQSPQQEHHYADKKGRWGWIMMDWAMQPFHTLLLTFTFAPYFTARVAPSAVEGQEMWAYAIAIGGIIVGLLAPVLGTLADDLGRRKPWIFAFMIVAAIGAWLLWYLVPNASQPVIMWGLCSLIICMVGFEFIAVFVNSMMPGLVPRERLGSLSGTSWAIGYIGGLISLAFCLLFLATNPETLKTFLGTDPAFGLDPVTGEGDRATGPFTAIWLLVFSVPFFLFTPDYPNPNRPTGSLGKTVRNGLVHLGKRITNLPKTPSLFSFLLASMFYRDGLNGLYAFGGIFAAGVLGWDTIHLAVFGILAAMTGAIGGWVGGRMDDQYGTRPVVIASTCILIVVCLIVFSVDAHHVLFLPVGEKSNLPTIVFYISGSLIGAAGGALQASSRVLMADQAEPGKLSEGFGLYGLTGRATSFIAPILVGIMTTATGSQHLGVTPIVVLFIVGLILLRKVRPEGDFRGKV